MADAPKDTEERIGTIRSSVDLDVAGGNMPDVAEFTVEEYAFRSDGPADANQFGKLGTLAATKLMTAALGIVAAATLGILQPALGAESGVFRMSIDSTYNYATVRQSDGTVFGGGMTGSGVILDSTGDPFTKDARSDVTCVVHGKKTAARFDLKTSCALKVGEGGDEFYVSGGRTMGSMTAGGGGTGRLIMDGGTGKFSGVRGTCDYETTYHRDNTSSTAAACSWERP